MEPTAAAATGVQMMRNGTTGVAKQESLTEGGASNGERLVVASDRKTGTTHRIARRIRGGLDLILPQMKIRKHWLRRKKRRIKAVRAACRKPMHVGSAPCSRNYDGHTKARRRCLSSLREKDGSKLDLQAVLRPPRVRSVSIGNARTETRHAAHAMTRFLIGLQIPRSTNRRRTSVLSFLSTHPKDLGPELTERKGTGTSIASTRRHLTVRMPGPTATFYSFPFP